MNRAFYIRTAIAFVLIFGVYTETGKWTAISFGLVVLQSEIKAVIRRRKSRNLVLTDYGATVVAKRVHIPDWTKQKVEN